MKAPKFKVEHTSRSVLTLKLDMKAGRDQWFLLTADRHWDNPDSDQAMQRKHLKEAKERGAWCLDFGDFFCAMQGKFDKRSDKSKLRPEHSKGDYLDSLVKTAAQEFAGENLLMIGEGNHESSIMKRHETNLVERLVERLKDKGNPFIHHGGFSGWVRFQIAEGGTNRKTINLNYHHGYGGGGPVTRDVIQTNRRAVYLPDAHIVVSGHTHDEWQVPIQRVRLSDQGALYTDEQYHVKIPSYKDEYKDGAGGWHIETGKPPKPKGAIWMRLWVVNHVPQYEFTRAK